MSILCFSCSYSVVFTWTCLYSLLFVPVYDSVHAASGQVLNVDCLLRLVHACCWAQQCIPKVTAKGRGQRGEGLWYGTDSTVKLSINVISISRCEALREAWREQQGKNPASQTGKCCPGSAGRKLQSCKWQAGSITAHTNLSAWRRVRPLRLCVTPGQPWVSLSLC